MRICPKCQEVSEGPGACTQCGENLDEGTIVRQFDEQYDLDLEDRLGGGGFGTVYRCTKKSDPRKAYAVKLIDLDSAVDDRERDILRLSFIRESKALAQVDHPHVIRLIDYGVYDASRLYVVTELLPRTLHDLLVEDGSIGLARMTEIGLQIAEALEYLHGLGDGYIHRDLKPSNVGLDAMGRVRLLDFGVVKIFGQALERQGGISARRESFVFAGSMSYGGIEQFGFGEVGPWSDVHAFGGVLFHMIAKRPPRKNADIPQLLKLEPAPPLPDDPARPEELDDLIAACLEPRPGDRPQTITRVRGRLEHIAELIQMDTQSLDAERAAIEEDRQALADDRKAFETERKAHESQLAGKAKIEADLARARAAVHDAERTTATLIAKNQELKLAFEEAESAQTILLRRSRDLTITAACLFLSIIIGTLAWWSSYQSYSKTEAPRAARSKAAVPAPKAATEIAKDTFPARPTSVEVRSAPSGAEIVDLASGAVLGRSPLTIELEPDTKSMEIQLRRAGYLSKRIEIGRTAREDVVLTREPTSGPPPSSGTGNGSELAKDQPARRQ